MTRPALAVGVAFAAALSAPSVARAQQRCDLTAPATARWAAPLDRVVNIREAAPTLGSMLDRVAAAGKFRISYSSDLVPLTRAVCGVAESARAGAVLSAVLRQTGVEAVVIGRDQVALRPVQQSVPDRAQPEPELTSFTLLEPVKVQSQSGLDLSKLPFSGREVTAEDLERRGGATRSLDQSLEGIAGLWTWERAPSMLGTRYASLRGASSFGISVPKIYLDGIEVADPLFFAGISPDVVQRIDVIRGPQGAALYGAGAIAGVIDITTRREAPGDGRSLELRSGGGASQSAFAASAIRSQEHALSIRSGSPFRSSALHVSLGNVGNFLGSASRSVSAVAGARTIGSRMRLDLTGRFYAQDAGAPRNPLLPSLATAGLSSTDTLRDQTMRQYTAAATSSFGASAWTHTATAGIDGYRLGGSIAGDAPLASPADSAFRAAHGQLDRATLRFTSATTIDRTLGSTKHEVSTRLTLTGEHVEAREARGLDDSSLVAWRHNSGVVANAVSTIDDALVLTAGLRAERMAGYAGAPRVATLPSLGAAFTRRVGPASLTARAAAGSAIRPFGLHEGSAPRYVVLGTSLSPETQSGVEAGLDARFGRTLTLRGTRFRQRATGLVQSVPIHGGIIDGEQLADFSVLETSGAIVNRGWELESEIVRGRFSLMGAFTSVDSRVAALANGSESGLNVGDRMLEVPRRTASLMASWSGTRWSTSWSAVRASDWVGYDRVALAGLPSSTPISDVPLRSYWSEYVGATRVRGTLARDLFHGFRLNVTGDNLLNAQVGEPDNASIVLGRTVSVGIRAIF